MRVTTAQLPGAGQSDDRIFVGPDAVVMLDGASAFLPTDVTAAHYVDHLGPALLDLVTHPGVGLVDALGNAIEHTASVLNLSSGSAPSSTVAIARAGRDVVDLLVLGDTQIVTPQRIIMDDRIACIGTAQRTEYQARLRDGQGYDEQHQVLLKSLQQEQRRHRNLNGGYWIAEADSTAAAHALVAQLDLATTPWLAVATDGAYRTMTHLGLDDWAHLVKLEEADLQRVLNRCHEWESQLDPKGSEMPRAKQHDDKSLAVVNFGSE